MLTSQEEIELYSLLIKYLKTEHDFTASTPEYGWIDAIPHCCDALSEAIKQKNFSSQLIEDLFQATDKLLKNIDKNLDHNELSRLAAIYINGFKNKKITNQRLLLWSNQLSNIESKNSNVVNLLTDICNQLIKFKLITSKIKNDILYNLIISKND